MLKSLSLALLIGLTTLVGSPVGTVAQTANDVAPVPGPYRAAPQVTRAGATAFSAPTPASTPTPDMRQMMPYWMRPAQPPAGYANQGPVQQRYINGWVWSPYAPNATRGQNRPVAQAGQRPPQSYGAFYGSPYGFRPGPAMMTMKPQGNVPWAQNRGMQNRGQNWPNRPYGPPPQYGGARTPNQ